MLERLAEIIGAYFDVTADDITEDTNIFEDLAGSDYDIAKLFRQIEEELNLDEIPEEEAERLADIGELVSYCIEQTGEEE